MATVSLSLPADGSTADAADYNTPINTIVDEFNGNIDNANIKSGAAIDGAKLADASVTSVKLAAPVAFSAYETNSAGQTLSTTATITHQTEDFDLGSNYDTGTYTFTAPYTGVYFFEHTLTVDALGADEVLTASLQVNGSTVRASNTYSDTADTAADDTANCVCLISLTANDTVVPKGSRTGSGAVIGGSARLSRFSGFLVGRTA